MSTISSTTSAHRAVAVREHQHRLGAFAFNVHAVIHAHQRHQLAAVLHHMAAVRKLDLAGVDLLEPSDQRERHSLGLGRAGAEHQQRGRVFVVGGVASLGGFSQRPPARRRRSPSDCATPFGSTIMITEPSPRMVLPDNMGMWRSLLDSGFTTISSVWNTLSTTRPKLWLPTCVTTMIASLDIALGFDAEQSAQARQRQQFVAQAQHRGVLDALNPVFAAGAHPHQLDHGNLRDRETVAAGRDDQGRDDRERERDLDGEARVRRRRPTSHRWCRRSDRYCCVPRPCRRRGRKRWSLWRRWRSRARI